MHHSLTSRPTVTQYASACNVADTGWSKKRGTEIEPATIRAAIKRSAAEVPARRRGRNGIAFTITTPATRSHAPSLRRTLVNTTLDSPDSSDDSTCSNSFVDCSRSLHPVLITSGADMIAPSRRSERSSAMESGPTKSRIKQILIKGAPHNTIRRQALH